MDAYIIKSSSQMKVICDDLEKCGGFACAKIIYNKTPKGRDETNNTLVVCKLSTYENMIKLPEYQDKIKRYNWQNFYSPSEEKLETWDLHITGLPKTFSREQAAGFIRERIHKIVPDHIYDNDNNVKIESFKINFDSTSRETGNIFGYGSLVFDARVDEHDIKLCKLALHNSFYNFTTPNGEQQRFISCVWHINKTTPVVKAVAMSSSSNSAVTNSGSTRESGNGTRNYDINTFATPRGRSSKNYTRKIFREPPSVQTVTVSTDTVNSVTAESKKTTISSGNVLVNSQDSNVLTTTTTTSTQ